MTTIDAWLDLDECILSHYFFFTHVEGIFQATVYNILPS